MDTTSHAMDDDGSETLSATGSSLRTDTKPIVGRSRALDDVHALVRQVAGTDSTVLLLGETGTGKELFASLVHDLGERAVRP